MNFLREKDCGYAWFILFLSFLSHMAHLGFSAGVAGNLTVIHQQYFNINLQESSNIGSVHFALTQFLGKRKKVLSKIRQSD